MTTLTDDQIRDLLAVCVKRTPGEWANEPGNASYTDDHGHARLLYHVKTEPDGAPLLENCFPKDAAYVVTTTDPATGYEAALREILRLRAVLAEEVAAQDVACCEDVPGTQNLCTRDYGHAGEHRCSAADVDTREHRWRRKS